MEITETLCTYVFPISLKISDRANVSTREIHIHRKDLQESLLKQGLYMYILAYIQDNTFTHLVLWAASLEVWSLTLPTTTTQLQPHLAWLPGGHRSYNPGNYRDDPF